MWGILGAIGGFERGEKTVFDEERIATDSHDGIRYRVRNGAIEVLI